MSNDPAQRPPLYSQIDVANTAYSSGSQSSVHAGAGEVAGLLRELVSAQDRQNELLEEMVNQMAAAQRQRAAEVSQWKQANPDLARNCRLAAEALSKVQTEYLSNLTEEINENFETLRDGEFMLNEFVDRFGPRLAHLNGLLQVLSQLSGPNNTSGATA